MDKTPHGVFATRAPCRPNPLGLSSVRLLEISGHRLRVSGVDMLDGTPLLDLKPYVPRFDVYPVQRSGWLDQATHRARDNVTADQRFERPETGDET
jgi:tRNA (Thr-GGU) A37 N-methylase